MKAENILDAIGIMNDWAVYDAGTYQRSRPERAVKWWAAAACFCLILTAALVMLPWIQKAPVVSDSDAQPGTYAPGPTESVPTQAADTRAKAWYTAEELGLAKQQEAVVAGLCVPAFLSYRGGFYGTVDEHQLDSPRFAPLESEKLRFNTHYTHAVYLVEDHPNCIAIHINGLVVYEKLFDVTFEVDGTGYAIAYAPVMNADYGLGDVVLETEDYTVYEAVKLQGEAAQTREYIVDILPLLQRELPNFFDGSDLESDGDYGEQWQLALPLA